MFKELVERDPPSELKKVRRLFGHLLADALDISYRYEGPPVQEIIHDFIKDWAVKYRRTSSTFQLAQDPLFRIARRHAKNVVRYHKEYIEADEDWKADTSRRNLRSSIRQFTGILDNASMDALASVKTASSNSFSRLSRWN